MAMGKSQKALAPLLKKLNLGELLQAPVPVGGGLSHEVWRLVTTSGAYALKRLSAKTMEAHRPLEAIIQGEVIAEYFAKYNIPAHCALKYQGAAIFNWQGDRVLLTPWINNTVSAVKPMHAKVVGQVLASMHQLNCQIVAMDYLAKPTARPIDWSRLLLTLPKEISQKITALLPMMEQVRLACLAEPLAADIISHNDMNPTNILWPQRDTLRVIDWEAAGKVNKNANILSTAVDWALLLSPEPNWSMFAAVLVGYQSKLALPVWQERAWLQVLLQWVSWLWHQVVNTVSLNNAYQGLINSVKVLEQLQSNRLLFERAYSNLVSV